MVPPLFYSGRDNTQRSRVPPAADQSTLASSEPQLLVVCRWAFVVSPEGRKVHVATVSISAKGTTALLLLECIVHVL